MFRYFLFSLFLSSISILAHASLAIVPIEKDNNSALRSNTVIVGTRNGSIAQNLIGNDYFDILWRLDGLTVSNVPHFTLLNDHIGSQIQFCLRKRNNFSVTCTTPKTIVEQEYSIRNVVINSGYTTNYIYDKLQLTSGRSIASKANFHISSGTPIGVLIYGKDQNNDIVESRYIPVSSALSNQKVYNVFNRRSNLDNHIQEYSSCSILLFHHGTPPASQETCKGPFRVSKR
ncbi:hypothetical protein QTN94_18180 [Vibrio sp. M250220]|uniref:hypothetical protein n=1 Tax=Vibrio sp. M250220 TaxID=3020894 RepID=UPI002F3E382A